MAALRTCSISTRRDKALNPRRTHHWRIDIEHIEAVVPESGKHLVDLAHHAGNAFEQIRCRSSSDNVTARSWTSEPNPAEGVSGWQMHRWKVRLVRMASIEHHDIETTCIPSQCVKHRRQLGVEARVVLEYRDHLQVGRQQIAPNRALTQRIGERSVRYRIEAE